jgi:RecB family exonuclease
VLERFINERTGDNDRKTLMRVAGEVLEEEAPWPATRALWLAKLDRVADWFLAQEAERHTWSRNIANEVEAKQRFDAVNFTLTGYADRIDETNDGTLVIYDYKTGNPPTADMQKHFDKQLLLEAVIAEQGGFADLGPRIVSQVAYIGLGSTPKLVSISLEQEEIQAVAEEFENLIRAYQDPAQGYTSRRAVHKQRFDGDHDHLARFGEWDDSQEPEPQEVGQ